MMPRTPTKGKRSPRFEENESTEPKDEPKSYARSTRASQAKQVARATTKMSEERIIKTRTQRKKEEAELAAANVTQESDQLDAQQTSREEKPTAEFKERNPEHQELRDSPKETMEVPMTNSEPIHEEERASEDTLHELVEALQQDGSIQEPKMANKQADQGNQNQTGPVRTTEEEGDENTESTNSKGAKAPKSTKSKWAKAAEIYQQIRAEQGRGDKPSDELDEAKHQQPSTKTPRTPTPKVLHTPSSSREERSQNEGASDMPQARVHQAKASDLETQAQLTHSTDGGRETEPTKAQKAGMSADIPAVPRRAREERLAASMETDDTKDVEKAAGESEATNAPDEPTIGTSEDTNAGEAANETGDATKVHTETTKEKRRRELRNAPTKTDKYLSYESGKRSLKEPPSSNSNQNTDSQIRSTANETTNGPTNSVHRGYDPDEKKAAESLLKTQLTGNRTITQVHKASNKVTRPSVIGNYQDLNNSKLSRTSSMSQSDSEEEKRSQGEASPTNSLTNSNAGGENESEENNQVEENQTTEMEVESTNEAPPNEAPTASSSNTKKPRTLRSGKSWSNAKTESSEDEQSEEEQDRAHRERGRTTPEGERGRDQVDQVDLHSMQIGDDVLSRNQLNQANLREEDEQLLDSLAAEGDAADKAAQGIQQRLTARRESRYREFKPSVIRALGQVTLPRELSIQARNQATEEDRRQMAEDQKIRRKRQDVKRNLVQHQLQRLREDPEADPEEVAEKKHEVTSSEVDFEHQEDYIQWARAAVLQNQPPPNFRQSDIREADWAHFSVIYHEILRRGLAGQIPEAFRELLTEIDNDNCNNIIQADANTERQEWVNRSNRQFNLQSSKAPKEPERPNENLANRVSRELSSERRTCDGGKKAGPPSRRREESPPRGPYGRHEKAEPPTRSGDRDRKRERDESHRNHKPKAHRSDIHPEEWRTVTAGRSYKNSLTTRRAETSSDDGTTADPNEKMTHAIEVASLNLESRLKTISLPPQNILAETQQEASSRAAYYYQEVSRLRREGYTDKEIERMLAPLKSRLIKTIKWKGKTFTLPTGKYVLVLEDNTRSARDRHLWPAHKPGQVYVPTVAELTEANQIHIPQIIELELMGNIRMDDQRLIRRAGRYYVDHANVVVAREVVRKECVRVHEYVFIRRVDLTDDERDLIAEQQHEEDMANMAPRTDAAEPTNNFKKRPDDDDDEGGDQRGAGSGVRNFLTTGYQQYLSTKGKSSSSYMQQPTSRGGGHTNSRALQGPNYQFYIAPEDRDIDSDDEFYVSSDSEHSSLSDDHSISTATDSEEGRGLTGFGYQNVDQTDYVREQVSGYDPTKTIYFNTCNDEFMYGTGRRITESRFLELITICSPDRLGERWTLDNELARERPDILLLFERGLHGHPNKNQAPQVHNPLRLTKAALQADQRGDARNTSTSNHRAPRRLTGSQSVSSNDGEMHRFATREAYEENRDRLMDSPTKPPTSMSKSKIPISKTAASSADVHKKEEWTKLTRTDHKGTVTAICVNLINEGSKRKSLLEDQTNTKSTLSTEKTKGTAPQLKLPTPAKKLSKAEKKTVQKERVRTANEKYRAQSAVHQNATPTSQRRRTIMSDSEPESDMMTSPSSGEDTGYESNAYSAAGSGPESDSFSNVSETDKYDTGAEDTAPEDTETEDEKPNTNTRFKIEPEDNDPGRETWKGDAETLRKRAIKYKLVKSYWPDLESSLVPIMQNRLTRELIKLMVESDKNGKGPIAITPPIKHALSYVYEYANSGTVVPSMDALIAQEELLHRGFELRDSDGRSVDAYHLSVFFKPEWEPHPNGKATTKLDKHAEERISNLRKKGRMLYGGTLITKDQYDALPAERRRYCMSVLRGERYIDGSWTYPTGPYQGKKPLTSYFNTDRHHPERNNIRMMTPTHDDVEELEIIDYQHEREALLSYGKQYNWDYAKQAHCITIINQIQTLVNRHGWRTKERLAKFDKVRSEFITMTTDRFRMIRKVKDKQLIAKDENLKLMLMIIRVCDNTYDEYYQSGEETPENTSVKELHWPEHIFRVREFREELAFDNYGDSEKPEFNLQPYVALLMDMHSTKEFIPKLSDHHRQGATLTNAENLGKLHPTGTKEGSETPKVEHTKVNPSPPSRRELKSRRIPKFVEWIQNIDVSLGLSNTDHIYLDAFAEWTPGDDAEPIKLDRAREILEHFDDLQSYGIENNYSADTLLQLNQVKDKIVNQMEVIQAEQNELENSQLRRRQYQDRIRKEENIAEKDYHQHRQNESLIKRESEIKAAEMRRKQQELFSQHQTTHQYDSEEEKSTETNSPKPYKDLKKAKATEKDHSARKKREETKAEQLTQVKIERATKPIIQVATTATSKKIPRRKKVEVELKSEVESHSDNNSEATEEVETSDTENEMQTTTEWNPVRTDGYEWESRPIPPKSKERFRRRTNLKIGNYNHRYKDIKVNRRGKSLTASIPNIPNNNLQEAKRKKQPAYRLQLDQLGRAKYDGIENISPFITTLMLKMEELNIHPLSLLETLRTGVLFTDDAMRRLNDIRLNGKYPKAFMDIEWTDPNKEEKAILALDILIPALMLEFEKDLTKAIDVTQKIERLRLKTPSCTGVYKLFKDLMSLHNEQSVNRRHNFDIIVRDFEQAIKNNPHHNPNKVVKDYRRRRRENTKGDLDDVDNIELSDEERLRLFDEIVRGIAIDALEDGDEDYEVNIIDDDKPSKHNDRGERNKSYKQRRQSQPFLHSICEDDSSEDECSQHTETKNSAFDRHFDERYHERADKNMGININQIVHDVKRKGVNPRDAAYRAMIQERLPLAQKVHCTLCGYTGHTYQTCNVRDEQTGKLSKTKLAELTPSKAAARMYASSSRGGELSTLSAQQYQDYVDDVNTFRNLLPKSEEPQQQQPTQLPRQTDQKGPYTVPSWWKGPPEQYDPNYRKNSTSAPQPDKRHQNNNGQPYRSNKPSQTNRQWNYQGQQQYQGAFPPHPQWPHTQQSAQYGTAYQQYPPQFQPNHNQYTPQQQVPQQMAQPTPQVTYPTQPALLTNQSSGDVRVTSNQGGGNNQFTPPVKPTNITQHMMHVKSEPYTRQYPTDSESDSGGERDDVENSMDITADDQPIHTVISNKRPFQEDERKEANGKRRSVDQATLATPNIHHQAEEVMSPNGSDNSNEQPEQKEAVMGVLLNYAPIDRHSMVVQQYVINEKPTNNKGLVYMKFSVRGITKYEREGNPTLMTEKDQEGATVHIQYDGGAGSSVISDIFAKRQNIPLLRRRYRTNVIGFNGAKVPIEHYVIVVIGVEGRDKDGQTQYRSFYTQAMVTPGLHVDFILGSNVALEHNIVVYPDSRRATIFRKEDELEVDWLNWSQIQKGIYEKRIVPTPKSILMHSMTITDTNVETNTEPMRSDEPTPRDIEDYKEFIAGGIEYYCNPDYQSKEDAEDITIKLLCRILERPKVFTTCSREIPTHHDRTCIAAMILIAQYFNLPLTQKCAQQLDEIVLNGNRKKLISQTNLDQLIRKDKHFKRALDICWMVTEVQVYNHPAAQEAALNTFSISEVTEIFDDQIKKDVEEWEESEVKRAEWRQHHATKTLNHMRPPEFPEELWEWVHDDEKPKVMGRYEKFDINPQWKHQLIQDIMNIDISTESRARTAEKSIFLAQCLANINKFGHPDPNNQPKMKDCDFKIELYEGEELKPINTRPQKFDLIQKAFLFRKINKMLEEGKLEHSTSPWKSRLVLVPYQERITKFMEKHGDNAAKAMMMPEHAEEVMTFYRLTVDFRGLNDKTIALIYPMPIIPDLIAKFTGMDRISLGDIQDAFFTVALEEGSKEYCAISVPGVGHVQFACMGQGLKNAAVHFNMCMTRKFSELIQNDRPIMVYQDDVGNRAIGLIEHLLFQQIIYDIMEENNMVFKIAKTHLNYKAHRILGQMLSSEGRRPDTKTVEAIRALAVPKTITDLRSVLGLFQYCGEFVSHLASLNDPLRDLLKKSDNIERDWQEDVHGTAFEAMKLALTSAPILKIPDLNKSFVVQVDACRIGRGIGAILLQKDEKDQLRPCAFYSRALTDSERRYSATELECTSLHNSIIHWKAYLNNGIPFEVIVDHYALVYMVMKMGNDQQNQRLVRLCLDLQGYNFKVTHINGVKHLGADAVSRLLRHDEEPYVRNADTLRDDYEPLTKDEVEMIRREHADPGTKWIIDTINNRKKEMLLKKQANQEEILNQMKDRAFMDNNSSDPEVANLPNPLLADEAEEEVEVECTNCPETMDGNNTFIHMIREDTDQTKEVPICFECSTQHTNITSVQIAEWRAKHLKNDLRTLERMRLAAGEKHQYLQSKQKANVETKQTLATKKIVNEILRCQVRHTRQRITQLLDSTKIDTNRSTHENREDSIPHSWHDRRQAIETVHWSVNQMNQPENEPIKRRNDSLMKPVQVPFDQRHRTGKPLCKVMEIPIEAERTMNPPRAPKDFIGPIMTTDNWYQVTTNVKIRSINSVQTEIELGGDVSHLFNTNYCDNSYNPYLIYTVIDQLNPATRQYMQSVDQLTHELRPTTKQNPPMGIPTNTQAAKADKWTTEGTIEDDGMVIPVYQHQPSEIPTTLNQITEGESMDDLNEEDDIPNQTTHTMGKIMILRQFKELPRKILRQSRTHPQPNTEGAQDTTDELLQRIEFPTYELTDCIHAMHIHILALTNISETKDYPPTVLLRELQTGYHMDHNARKVIQALKIEPNNGEIFQQITDTEPYRINKSLDRLTKLIPFLTEQMPLAMGTEAQDNQLHTKRAQFWHRLINGWRSYLRESHETTEWTMAALDKTRPINLIDQEAMRYDGRRYDLDEPFYKWIEAAIDKCVVLKLKPGGFLFGLQQGLYFKGEAEKRYQNIITRRKVGAPRKIFQCIPDDEEASEWKIDERLAQLIATLNREFVIKNNFNAKTNTTEFMRIQCDTDADQHWSDEIEQWRDQMETPWTIDQEWEQKQQRQLYWNTQPAILVKLRTRICKRIASYPTAAIQMALHNPMATPALKDELYNELDRRQQRRQPTNQRLEHQTNQQLWDRLAALQEHDLKTGTDQTHEMANIEFILTKREIHRDTKELIRTNEELYKQGREADELAGVLAADPNHQIVTDTTNKLHRANFTQLAEEVENINIQSMTALKQAQASMERIRQKVDTLAGEIETSIRQELNQDYTDNQLSADTTEAKYGVIIHALTEDDKRRLRLKQQGNLSANVRSLRQKLQLAGTERHAKQGLAILRRRQASLTKIQETATAALQRQRNEQKAAKMATKGKKRTKRSDLDIELAEEEAEHEQDRNLNEHGDCLIAQFYLHPESNQLYRVIDVSIEKNEVTKEHQMISWALPMHSEDDMDFTAEPHKIPILGPGGTIELVNQMAHGKRAVDDQMAPETPEQWKAAQEADQYCQTVFEAMGGTPNAIFPLDNKEAGLSTDYLYRQDGEVTGMLMRRCTRERKVKSSTTEVHITREHILVVVPDALTEKVIWQMHDCMGHPGRTRCHETIRLKYYWPKQYDQIKQYCQNCRYCNLRKANNRVAKPPIQIYDICERPWCRVHMDLAGPFPLAGGENKYIMVIKCALSKWVVFIPLISKEMHEVQSKYIDYFVSQFGAPEVLITDRGTEFKNRIAKQLAALWQVRKIETTPRNPRADGQVENQMRTLKDMLQAFTNEHHDNWHEALPLAAQAYNTTVNDATGFTPYYLVHGTEMTNADLNETIKELDRDEIHQIVQDTREVQQWCWEYVARRVRTNSDKGNRIPAERLPFIPYQTGDFFFLRVIPKRHYRTDKEAEKASLSAKLQYRYTGPYMITKVLSPILYEANIHGKTKRTHALNMKPTSMHKKTVKKTQSTA